MCDRDKRQKNLMVIFNRSCCKIEDDLGIWCRGIQLEIRKNDKGTLHLGCGQLSRKNVPPSARVENFMVALPRERKGASLYLTDNANRVQAQLALLENFPPGTFRGKVRWVILTLENLSTCRKVLKLSKERLKKKCSALCGGRSKALPLKSATF